MQVHTLSKAFSEAEPAAGLVPSTSIEPAPSLYRAVSLHDYEPNNDGEVMMKGNETMDVYFEEDERILVKIDRKSTVSQPAIGYVPANYVKKAEDGREVKRSNTPLFVVLTAISGSSRPTRSGV